MNKNISIDELFKENRIVVPEPNPIVANKIYQKYQNNNQRKKSQTIFFKRTLLPIGSLTIFIVFIIAGISFIFHPSYKDDKKKGFNYDKSPVETNPGSTPDESSLTNNEIFCTVQKDDVEFNASINLSFSSVGNNGTDYTFYLEFFNNENNFALPI